MHRRIVDGSNSFIQFIGLKQFRTRNCFCCNTGKDCDYFFYCMYKYNVINTELELRNMATTCAVRHGNHVCSASWQPHLSLDVCTLAGKMILGTQLPYLCCACGLGRRAENENVQGWCVCCVSDGYASHQLCT